MGLSNSISVMGEGASERTLSKATTWRASSVSKRANIRKRRLQTNLLISRGTAGNPIVHNMLPISRRLRRVTQILVKEYGRPRHGNRANALDELIYIILSAQTDEGKYRITFSQIKRRFRSWAEVTPLDELEIEQLIRPSGLSRYKAKYIVELLARLRNDFGKPTLAPLKRLSNQQAEAYLCSLPGVSLKTARCVLMYSLNRPVFPVDTHAFRILNRLGIVDLPQPIRKWHNVVQDIVPTDIRYDLHVTLLAHGRQVCKASNPECGRCNLASLCAFAREEPTEI